MDSQLLEIEITESAIMSNLDQAIRTMREINSLGVRLAIDDFGTGYSSLGALKLFPIHKLKIDQTFVRNLATDSNDAAITASIIALAKSMKLEVIAEGIETEEQLAFLRKKKCHQGQGYLFSRPIPVVECTALVAQTGKRFFRPIVAQKKPVKEADNIDFQTTEVPLVARRWSAGAIHNGDSFRQPILSLWPRRQA